MKSDRTIKNLREYDIQTFIDNNRIYTLSLIIAFYIISRLVTIVSIVKGLFLEIRNDLEDEYHIVIC